MSDYEHLLLDTTASGVRTIVLNRPERLNAVNPRLAVELPEAVAEAAAADEVRVVMITGAGRGFCAGLDLQQPALLDERSRAGRLDDLGWVGRWVLAVAECEKPVIAAMNGPAAGAGLGLALAADLRLLSDSAVLTTGYVRRGLSTDAGVSYHLPRLIGLSRATELIFSGRDVDASEAERIGLASAVFPAQDFAAAALGWAERLAAGPPVALALSKRLLRQSLDTALRAQLRDELTHIRSCFTTDDVREAMQAFVEKREAAFKGR